MPTTTLLLLLACHGAPPRPGAADGAAYADALAAVARDPAGAAAHCAAVPDAALRADCVTAGAEALAKPDPDAAAGLCAGLPDGVGRDECGFQVAERTEDAARCDAAGRFADDCRMHLWTRAVQRAFPPGTHPDEAEPELARLAAAAGFGPDDPRPWIAATRHLLGRMRPLDRGRCDGLSAPTRRKVCKDAARDLFHDRLNHARDTGTFPCDGGPLPDVLQHTPDPELDAIIAERKGRDLCP
jgi:hypothetical protein